MLKKKLFTDFMERQYSLKWVKKNPQNTACPKVDACFDMGYYQRYFYSRYSVSFFCMSRKLSAFLLIRSAYHFTNFKAQVPDRLSISQSSSASALPRQHMNQTFRRQCQGLEDPIKLPATTVIHCD
jgi:hypothetical protein